MMERIPEPELMEDMEQAVAYDEADFSVPHGERVDLFRERYKNDAVGEVLDLGCGSGDVLERFAKAFPDARFTGIDGAAAMLELSKKRMAKSGLLERMDFVQALIPSPGIPQKDYSVIMSHSLLHQLHRPEVLWQTVKQCANENTFVFVADLRRPASAEEAQRIMEEKSEGEPEVLRRDFYNSLCAAFMPEEIREQLEQAKISGLTVEETGEIHVLVYGRIS